MAQLFPANFDLNDLVYSERRVGEQLLANLDDSWFVVPQVTITSKGTDSEIDFVIVSPDHGIFCTEVKGGIITIEAGQWKSNGNKIKNPANQVAQAKHNLLRRLMSMKVDLSEMFVQHIVAFPDILDFPVDGAGLECPREIVFTKSDLASPHPRLSQLRHPDAHAVPANTIRAVLHALRPDVREVEVDGRYVHGVSQRINTVTRGNLDVLLPLDVNKRVLVEGAAGTGKTYLAHHWARRALQRGERTLFVCYNRALGNELHERTLDLTDGCDDPDLLRTGSFHSIANLLLGDHAPAVPVNADQDFWDHRHAEMLIQHRDNIPVRFDSIIIDEGQDFQPSWFTALEGLLANDESRLFVMTDPRQAIFAEPLVAPASTTRVPLTLNIRNAHGIANLVATLGGAEASPHSSPGPEIDIFKVGGAKERRKRIAVSISRANEELGIPLSQILVVVPHRADVAELTKEKVGDFTLSTWVERSEETVACGTIQGTKGLERLAVIVANTDDDPDPRLTYVGASRASVYLALIGSQTFIDQARCGRPTRTETPSEQSACAVPVAGGSPAA